MSRARGSTVLLVLSLVWLGAMLWSANANITGTGNAPGALIQVADALHVFEDQLLQLFGAASSPASQLAAASRLALTTSLLGGAAAGVTAFFALRRVERRFPIYLAAGAFPGVLLLLSEGVTLIGGAQIFGLVGGLSDADHAILEYVGHSPLNHALIMLFVRAIAALLCLGRNL